jgi:2-oxo-3-hexenedioate decarboxylase
MPDHTHRTFAAEIVAARQGRTTTTPPTIHDPAFSIEDGYRVGGRVTASALAEGARIVGYKLGLTNRDVWPVLGVDAPFWAPMFDTGILPSNRLDASAFVAPRVELEVLVGLSAPLGPGAGVSEVLDAIAWAAVSFEIVDSHYPEWKAAPADLIADHGCHVGVLVGEQVPGEHALLLGLDTLVLELTCDGACVAQAAGSLVLGGPVHALQGLLQVPGAPPLRVGDLISTGALTGRSHPVQRGERWEASRLSGPSMPLPSLEIV